MGNSNTVAALCYAYRHHHVKILKKMREKRVIRKEISAYDFQTSKSLWLNYKNLSTKTCNILYPVIF